MNRSNGVSSLINVRSYSWTASPKNNVKLYSITVYSFGPIGTFRLRKTGVLPDRSTT